MYYEILKTTDDLFYIRSKRYRFVPWTIREAYDYMRIPYETEYIAGYKWVWELKLNTCYYDSLNDAQTGLKRLKEIDKPKFRRPVEGEVVLIDRI